jgi:hypothetical protein
MYPGCEYIKGIAKTLSSGSPGRRLLADLSGRSALSCHLHHPQGLDLLGNKCDEDADPGLICALTTPILSHTERHTHSYVGHSELLDLWNLLNLKTVSSVSLLPVFLTQL